MANLISTQSLRIYTAPPAKAMPTRRVFTTQDGVLWRIYDVPNADPSVPWDSAEIAYPVDPANWG